MPNLQAPVVPAPVDLPPLPEAGDAPPVYSCGLTRWIDTSKYCGDNVRLECSITGGPPDGPATVEILHPSNGSVIHTINTTLTGGRFSATWVAKAQTSNWRTDQLSFRVQAAGLTCNSSNTFSFRARPTTGTVSQNYLRGCSASSTARKTTYDLELQPSQVLQTLKLKSLSDPSVPAVTVLTFEAAVETNVEPVWNNGFARKKFHRVGCQRSASCDCAFDCCKVGYELDVQFVASGEHRQVKVIWKPPPAAPVTSSCSNGISEWSYPAKAPTTTYAHEAGHMLGHYDEYATSCNDPAPAGTQYRQPATAPAGELNLMSTSGNTTLLNRHFRHILKFLNDKAAGDPYEIIPAGP